MLGECLCLSVVEVIFPDPFFYCICRLILPEPATCLSVSPQNNYLAVGIGSKLFIWQLASGKLLTIQQKHFQPITCIKFSSDGDIILAGGQDGMLVAYLVGDIVSVVTNFLEQSEIGQAEPLYVKNDHSMPIRDIHIGIYIYIEKK